MKIFKYLSIAMVFMVSCQSEPDKTKQASKAPVNIDHSKTLVVPWNVELNDSTQMMEIKKDPAADMNNLEADDIVDALNLKYPQIKLTWVKQEGNKAFVKIADAAYLTQQSGSEGAQAYLAEATFSLTELAGIAAVDFSFEGGDHAIPGTYTREDFKDFN